MADDNQTTTGQFEEDQSPQWYRDQLDRYKAQVAEKDKEVQTLNARLMQAAVERLGLDVEKGPGKAVADFYEGEPEADKIAEFAQQYGWSPAPAGDDQSQAARDAQERVAAATAGARPAEPPDIANEIAEAEAEGDWVKALQLKRRAVTDVFESR